MVTQNIEIITSLIVILLSIQLQTLHGIPMAKSHYIFENLQLHILRHYTNLATLILHFCHTDCTNMLKHILRSP